ncbi:plastid 50S ribosomal protein, putative [Plasmodium knowlesi strain H]|uniref:Plastid 50S ribosomal protein, putative n=3 Tax=Plasmodium knowlesi TaxID=5850 RepID=A0A5K1UXN1_PLAKH|nr:ribosomal protein L21, apicoplast, putative [Plasmodium knowlesi strain H]OTN67921.1 putative Plastid 50S ribosomal protein [Plasmodium knowlesi]CAA9990254.1 ribosomal protein L21, apicoplast, putative [Plasmodium knowlesi strain H]SBO26790.1 plastid 50S ribosomal protein, putative [Plasmodium knowlesi strain H]SBO28425.1 plastid 50S ribosomal protein, putative [Plasmodium knowlesi strain H]VVS79728.1 ribosomal protein L21, apicoplast, putative [Plasmodium knowlesi strain H]|eukprot:XP_002258047.1 Plastid 50S ribosomal protein, putative [Plasmodium knowlesi strain H]
MLFLGLCAIFFVFSSQGGGEAKVVGPPGRRANVVSPPRGSLTFVPSMNRWKPEGSRRSRVQVLINSPAQIKLSEIEDDRDRSGKFCVIEICGKARWVEEGRYYDVFRIKQEENKSIYLNRVFFYSTMEGKLLFGTPFLDNVRIKATVMKHFRGNKIYRLKFKPKKNYKRFYGHRQEMSRIYINKIEINNNLMDRELRKYNFFRDDSIYYVLNRIHNMVRPSLELKHLKKHFMDYLNKFCSVKFETFYKHRGNYKKEKMLRNILKTKKLSKRPEVMEEVKKIEEEKERRRLNKYDPLADFDPVANECFIREHFYA